jgi:hypothetical protein
MVHKPSIMSNSDIAAYCRLVEEFQKLDMLNAVSPSV